MLTKRSSRAVFVRFRLVAVAVIRTWIQAPAGGAVQAVGRFGEAVGR